MAAPKSSDDKDMTDKPVALDAILEEATGKADPDAAFLLVVSG